MTKTKKKSVVAGIAAMSLACCVAGSIAVGGGIKLNARAADSFGADSEGGFVCPGGASEANILAAINAKIAKINQTIETVNADGTKTLEEAYAEGTVIAYSNKNDGIITKADNRRSGWKVWEQLPLTDLKEIHGGYSWDNGTTAIHYNGEDGKAYLVSPLFADAWYGSNAKKLGTAVGDPFRVNNITYQNFTGGYLKLDDGTVSEVAGKNANGEGAEIAANPKAILGAATLDFEGIANAKLYQAFVTAYERYVANNYNPGYPFTVVRKEGDLILQHLRNGDSTANPYNDGSRNHWSYLVYNKDMEQAFLMRDEFVKGDGSGDDIKKIGAPVGDMFTKDDVKYQNFEKGYGKVESGNLSIVAGKNFNEDTGLEETLDEEGKIGKLSKAVTENLPAGVTAAKLSTAFKAAYQDKVEFASDEKLASIDLVTYENGLLLQTYTDSKDAKHKLVYVEGKFFYLRPAVVSKMGGLGAPVGERIRVAWTKNSDGKQEVYAYPFVDGYVRLVVSAQKKIQGGDVVSVIVESAVATSGATYDSEKGFFETKSFSDRITASMVSQDILDQAYWSIWDVEKPTQEKIAAAFKKAYDDAFAIGFSAGEPSGEGIMWWVTSASGLIKLTLKGGNGNGDFWNDNTLMSYNPYDGKAYITTGEIATKYSSGGASGNGWATTEMKINTATGVIVQQFDITDTDVTHRQIYIIVADGKADKIDGVYDFEANKNGGEWVDYLTQFGGSIAQKPLSEETKRNEGEKVEIDFASYVTNKDGYIVTWNKVSGKGTLSADGKYVLDAMTKENDEVVVEVYSAFDKLTFRITLTVDGGSVNPDPTPGGDKNEGKGGCKSSISVSLAIVGGMLAVGTVAGGVAFKKRKK